MPNRRQFVIETINKTFKIEIIKASEVKWEEFHEILSSLQYSTWKMLNKGIQICWDFNNFDLSYKNMYGSYFKKDNNTLPSGAKDITTDITNLTENYNYIMPGKMKPAIAKIVKDIWENNFEKIVNGEISIPSFKSKYPIILHNQQMMDSKRIPQFYNDNGTYTIIINLLSKKYATEKYGLKDGRFNIILGIKDNYQKNIFSNILNGEFKLGSGKISYNENKKKWFLTISYSFKRNENENFKTITNNSLFLDMTDEYMIRLHPLGMEFKSQNIGEFHELILFNKQIKLRKYNIQKKIDYSLRNNKNIYKLKKKLELLSVKQENYKKTKNHIWTKNIIDEAIKYNCTTIIISKEFNSENLSKKIGHWPIFDFLSKLEFKARTKNIKLLKK